MAVAGAGTSEDLSATALGPSVERHKSRIIPASSQMTFNCNKKFSLGPSCNLNDLCCIKVHHWPPKRATRAYSRCLVYQRWYLPVLLATQFYLPVLLVSSTCQFYLSVLLASSTFQFNLSVLLCGACEAPFLALESRSVHRRDHGPWDSVNEVRHVDRGQILGIVSMRYATDVASIETVARIIGSTLVNFVHQQRDDLAEFPGSA